MAKFAEKLIVLNDVCGALCARLHTLKTTINDGQFTFVNDQAYKKVNTFLLKNFPETADGFDNVQGAELLKPPNGNELHRILEPHFFTFIDALDFKEEALSTILEIGQNIIKLSFEQNRTVMELYLRLVTGYCQLHVLLSSIQDRKLVCAIYARAKLLALGTAEKDYTRVGQYLKEFDAPWKKIQEDFMPVSSRLGETLMGLSLNFHNTIDPNDLRKKGCLDLFQNEQVTLPVNDKLHQELYYAQEYYIWILYGFLACPSELFPPGAVDLVKLALRECFALPIFRDEVLDIHNEYKELFGWYSIKDGKGKDLKLAKQKNVLKDASKAIAEETGRLHRQRRTYLKLEMTNMLNFLADQPGILAPKLQMVLTAMHLARDEIVWLFRHMGRQPPKQKLQLNPADYDDSDLPHLIYLIDQLTALVRKYRKYISDYYFEYVTGPHQRHLKPLVDDALSQGLDQGVTRLLKANLDAMDGSTRDFRAFRLNWARAQAQFSSAQSSAKVNLNKLDALNQMMNLICCHTRHVDELEDELNDCSLKLLYWFKPRLWEVFTKSLMGPDRMPVYCMSFVQLHHCFALNAHKMHPAEQAIINQSAVESGDKYLREICNVVRKLLYNLCKDKGYGKLEQQITPLAAAMRLKFELEGRASEPLPGHESHFLEPQNEFSAMLTWDRILPLLLSAIEETDEVQVVNTILVPREFLRDEIRNGLKEILSWVSQPQSSPGETSKAPVNRPSVMLSLFLLYVRTLKIVENYVNIDLMTLVEEVLHEEIFDPEITGRLACVDALLDPKEPMGKSIVHRYAKFYQTFIVQDATQNIFYSPLRKSFVSIAMAAGQPPTQGQLYKAEEFSDITELYYLCKLIGPYGARAIDIQMLRIIRSRATKLKEKLVLNRNVSEELARAFAAQQDPLPLIAKFKDLDDVFVLSTTIGMALAFRNNLHEALKLALSEDCPFIAKSLSHLANNYKHRITVRNLVDFEGLNRLMYESGAAKERADADLRFILFQLSNSLAEAQVWATLPYLMAGAFASKQWMGADYKVAVEGFVNNAHCIAISTSTLIDAFSTIGLDTNYVASLAAGTPPKEGIAGQSPGLPAQRKFIEISAWVLLRLRCQPDRAKIPQYFPITAIFLDKVMDETRDLPRNVLESNFPYALIRSIYTQLYESQRKKGAGRIEDWDAQDTAPQGAEAPQVALDRPPSASA